MEEQNNGKLIQPSDVWESYAEMEVKLSVARKVVQHTRHETDGVVLVKHDQVKSYLVFKDTPHNRLILSLAVMRRTWEMVQSEK